jgi:hypothetical protein
MSKKRATETMEVGDPNSASDSDGEEYDDQEVYTGNEVVIH